MRLLLASVVLTFLLAILTAGQDRKTFTVGNATAARGQKVTGTIEVPSGVDAGLSIPVAVVHGARIHWGGASGSGAGPRSYPIRRGARSQVVPGARSPTTRPVSRPPTRAKGRPATSDPSPSSMTQADGSNP